jgi:hypothetical protein
MNSILYIIATILIVVWAVGFFFTAIGGLIHLLLLIALVFFVFGLVRRPTAV